MTALILLTLLTNPRLADVPKPGACHYVVTKDGTVGPDPACTPGDTDTDDVEKLCTTLTATRRYKPDPAVHKAIAKAHDVPRCGEVDHRVPICLGGAETIKNLWCQPAPQYKLKDKLEAKLCRMICEKDLTKRLSLGAARILVLDPANWK
jgi:hypothetical protein